ncbi:MAG: hypothetical protein ISS19_05575 [Bacteroidales bacterium]|nr:hypothetical protein [Bacteroidales bacterium]
MKIQDNQLEFEKMFTKEEQYLEYLFKVRFPDGYISNILWKFAKMKAYLSHFTCIIGKGTLRLTGKIRRSYPETLGTTSESHVLHDMPVQRL